MSGVSRVDQNSVSQQVAADSTRSGQLHETEQKSNGIFQQKYPIEILEKQKAALLQKIPEKVFSPVEGFSVSGNQNDIDLGWELLRQGKVGTIILAGGMATRLNTELPKALFPVTPVKQKTLLQLVLEKTKAASEMAGRDLSIAIMTSPLNRGATESYLTEQGNCGLNNEQVDLFDQTMLPFLDASGTWLLEEPGKLAVGPDGNGTVFLSFIDSGIKDKWREKGIEMINIILIDNPLADPFDAEFIGFCHRNSLQIGIKSILRSTPEEKVGVIVKNHGHVEIAEYSEIPKEQSLAKKEDGTLLLPLANLSLFCASLPFIEELGARGDLHLPWHIAFKKAPVYEDGKKIQKEVYKFETFIFDILPLAQKVDVLVFPREDVFSPLKNASGDSSLETVQKSLIAYDRKILETVYGIRTQKEVLELDPSLYYPNDQLRQVIIDKGETSDNYISPY